MLKNREIRVLFLAVVYFSLLTAVILPHHHHQETACYTSTHCEDDADEADHHGEEPVDHQHDTSPVEPQNCLSTEYYVVTDSGISLKKASDYVVTLGDYQDFINAFIYGFDIKPQLIGHRGIFYTPPNKNTFTIRIKSELPLRAPPSSLA